MFGRFKCLAAVLFALSTILMSGACKASGGDPGATRAISFTDSRVTPTGSDLLAWNGLVIHDDWSVDIRINSTYSGSGDLVLGGTGDPGKETDRIWAAIAGELSPSKTIDVLNSYLLKLYSPGGGTGYYQFVYHVDNTTTNPETHVNMPLAPVKSYGL